MRGLPLTTELGAQRAIPMKQKKNARVRSLAIIQGFDESGKPVDTIEIPLDEYYDESHDLIDSKASRESKRIRRVMGSLFDSRGIEVQKFENLYDSSGEITSSQAVHEDGTVEDWRSGA